MRTLTRRCLLTLTLVAWLLPALSADAKVSVARKGERKQTTTAADWLRHPLGTKYYTEGWTTVLRSEDGHVLYVTFVYSNVGVLSGNASVNVSHAKPGPALAKHRRWNYGTGDYAQDKATGRLAIGPNSITLAGRKMDIVVKEKDFSLNLSLDGWTDGVKFHDGKVFLTDDKKEWVQTFFHMPRGSFTGKLTAGGETFTLKGDAYHDHTVQTGLSTDWSAKWWTLRLFAPEHSLCFISFSLPESLGGERVMRMMLTDRTKVLALSDEMRLTPGGERKDPKGHTYASRFQVSFKEGDIAFKGTLRGTRLHDREAFMEELSWGERKVAEMVAGNPIVYRLHAKPKVTLTLPSGEVALEGPSVIEAIVMRDEAAK